MLFPVSNQTDVYAVLCNVNQFLNTLSKPPHMHAMRAATTQVNRKILHFPCTILMYARIHLREGQYKVTHRWLLFGHLAVRFAGNLL